MLLLPRGSDEPLIELIDAMPRWMRWAYGFGWLAMAIGFTWWKLHDPQSWHTLEWKILTGVVGLVLGTVWPLVVVGALLGFLVGWLV